MCHINDRHVTGAAGAVKHRQQGIADGAALNGGEDEGKIFRPVGNEAAHQKTETELREYSQEEDDDDRHGVFGVIREHEGVEQDHRQHEFADDGLDRSGAAVAHHIFFAHQDADGKRDSDRQNHFNN